MTMSIERRPASGLAVLAVLLVASVTSCTAPTEAPTSSRAPGGSAAFEKLDAPYSFNRTITFDHTRIPNTDQKNFAVLIAGTFDGTSGTPDLRTTGNGGKVRNANAYDVGFYAASNCSDGKLKWEIEKYSATTGEAVIWVRIPLLSHTQNTVVYLCYGNGSITKDRSQSDGVWDGEYRAVWHLADRGGLVLTNSAGNNFPLTNSGPVASAPGKIGGGTNKFVDATYYLDDRTVSIEEGGAVTISLWKKLLAADSPPEGNAQHDFNHIAFGMGSGHGTSNSMTLWAPFDQAAEWFYGEGPGPAVAFAPYFDRWVHITCVYNPNANNLKALYIDGQLVASLTNGLPTVGIVTAFRLGQAPDGHGQDPSQFDEVRISNSARSADWIATEFNNQNNPASFYTIGSETTPQ
jgi:biopolymer transport protein ExbB